MIDQLIQENQLRPKGNDWNCWRWIEYKELDNIQFISEGGFGMVYKAQWTNMPEEFIKIKNYPTNVAVKKLKNSQKISQSFLNEVNLHNHSIDFILYAITLCLLLYF